MPYYRPVHQPIVITQHRLRAEHNRLGRTLGTYGNGANGTRHASHARHTLPGGATRGTAEPTPESDECRLLSGTADSECPSIATGSCLATAGAGRPGYNAICRADCPIVTSQ